MKKCLKTLLNNNATQIEKGSTDMEWPVSFNQDQDPQNQCSHASASILVFV